MPRTILCQKCGIVLNLPDKTVAGKRMKCPNCAHRFAVTEKDASAESTYPGDADAALITSQEFSSKPPSHDDLPISPGGRDLRDLFELPLGSGASIEQAAVSGRGPAVSDAEALFQDEPAARRKKPKGAEARAQARRCSHCGGAVPKGMSICVTCGVDQDTGMRVGLEDDLAPPPPPPSPGAPLHISITGFLCGLASVVLLVLALIQSVRVEAGVSQYGWLCLALVSGFGIYGAVQFIIGKSVKYLMLALTMGVFVNFASLIALPIVQANFEDRERVVSKVQFNKDDPNTQDTEDVEIKPIAERIDQQKITLGLTVILIYVLLSIYLMSPPVKRYFVRQAAIANMPIF
jgi:hypothetical protein